MVKLIAISVFTCALSFASSTEGFHPGGANGEWNVFGSDDRQAVTNSAWPWSSIGKIEVGRSSCTATLVGARLILTAAHCLKLRNGRLDSRYPHRFFPNVINNRSTVANSPQATAVWHGGHREGDGRHRDWAILLLDRQPKRSDGTTYGWIGVDGGTLYSGKLVGAVGYSGNFHGGRTAGADLSCQVRAAFRDGSFYHDCDGWVGISGGPMLARTGETKVVGITNAHFADGTNGKYRPYYTAGYANIGAAASRFIDTLLSLKRSYE